MNGKKYAIVGIMPRGFDYPVPMEFWTPLALTPAEKADRVALSLHAVDRIGDDLRIIARVSGKEA